MRLGLKLLLSFAVLCVVAAFGVSWRASAREAATEAEFPPQGELVTVGDHQVHAVVMGDGPDLVLIHGSNGNTRDMTLALAPKLAERYRVIVFDRPGLGYSDAVNPRGASIAEQAGVLADAAMQLGATRPIVMGQSYGGAVALAWAVHRPENIAALVPVASVSNPWESALDPLYRVTSSGWGSAIVVPLITAFVGEARVNRSIPPIFAPQTAPDDYAQSVGAALALRRGALRATALQRANFLSEIQTISPQYPSITVPTEIVHGDTDTTVPLHIHSEKLVAQIPDAVLTRLPGIGHMPHHVAADDVIAAIDRAAARAGLR
ncbi:MAG: alpha/beta hydrolase [Pseudomonadota bacterium]